MAHKQIILGDIHGRTIWREILAKERTWDRLILIGDYVDTHEDILGIEQLRNLEDIIEFKKAYFDKVICLVGNHDFHYWPSIRGLGQKYSGYQAGMHMSFEGAFALNKECFQMAFEDEHGTLYTHAGVTKTFYEMLTERCGIDPTGQKVSDVLNMVFESRPAAFCFYNGDYSNTGENVRQSCIWVRPQSLYNNKLPQFMVIGHTEVLKIAHPPKSERQGFYLIDCLARGQYLVCEDGKFEIRTFKPEPEAPDFD